MKTCDFYRSDDFFDLNSDKSVFTDAVENVKVHDN